MATDRMSRFEVFIGIWNTTGDVLKTDAAPATSMVATDTYRWLPGRHFIAHEADARFGGVATRSLEVIGYDAAGREYMSRSYDDQGASETYEVALKGRNWRINGRTTRFSGRFDATHSKLTGLWKLKGSKSGWQPRIQLLLVRAR